MNKEFLEYNLSGSRNSWRSPKNGARSGRSPAPRPIFRDPFWLSWSTESGWLWAMV